MQKISILFEIVRFGFKGVSTGKRADQYLILGAFWNGKMDQNKQTADLRTKNATILVMSMSGAFFSYKTWTEKDLEKKNALAHAT